MKTVTATVETEPFLCAALDRITNRRAIDVGAHNGLYYTTKLFAEGFEVDAFEPNVELFHALENRFAWTDRVRCHNYAVCETERTVTIPQFDGYDIFEQKGKPLDSFYFTAPGFIKIDTEGTEIDVLLGARELISKHRPVMLCELSSNTTEPKDLVDLIGQLGYAIHSVDGSESCANWAEMERHWPWHSSYDVLLLPVS